MARVFKRGCSRVQAIRLDMLLQAMWEQAPLANLTAHIGDAKQPCIPQGTLGFVLGAAAKPCMATFVCKGVLPSRTPGFGFGRPADERAWVPASANYEALNIHRP